jgi:hypothetical protein
MEVTCHDCGAKAHGTKDELIDLGWMGCETWIVAGKMHIFIKFELCPNHANGGRFAEIITEKAKKEGVDP